MEDTPPPLPARTRPAGPPIVLPSRQNSGPAARVTQTRIHGIEALRPSAVDNDYVDSRKLPAAVHGSSSNKKHNCHHELSENIATEQKESSDKPPLPPRQQHCHAKPTEPPPPPLLPRQAHRQNSQRTQLRQAGSERKPGQNVTLSPIHSHGAKLSSRPWPQRHLLPSVIVVESSSPSPPLRVPPVVRQPMSSNHVTASLDKGRFVNSIVCEQCGQCKCAACTQDRRLPEQWLCDGNCRCSADSVVDIASCMCVAKGLYYHTCNEEDNQCGGKAVSPHPCDCMETPKCCLRWAGLSLLTLCLPCLCCYLPLRAGVKVTEKCYNSPCMRKQGCQCDR